MTDPKPAPAAKADVAPAPPAKPAEAHAVLLNHAAGLPPGRIVRGDPARLADLIKSGDARKATPEDIGIAGLRTVAIK